MITLTGATVTGAPGMTVQDMDRETVQCAVRLGAGLLSPELAADWLRDVYAAVLATAGTVKLDSAKVSNGVRVAA